MESQLEQMESLWFYKCSIDNNASIHLELKLIRMFIFGTICDTIWLKEIGTYDEKD